MENKEDYVGYEDQELCNRYYKEAEVMRQKQDWSRLRAVPAPAKGTPSPGWGQLGRGNDVRVKYVSINSGLGGGQIMTVEELANKRYGGEFVFMFGHLEGRTRFVFECFDPRPDHEGKNTYMVSYFDKGLRRRDVVDVPCYMNVLAK